MISNGSTLGILALALVAATLGVATAIELSLAGLIVRWGYRKIRNGGHAIRWSHLAPTALCVVVVAIHVTLGPEMHQKQGMTKAIYDPASPYGVRLSRVPKPSRCNNGMMIIQVEAAALNPVDFKVLQLPAALPLLRWMLGNGVASDFSGHVVRTGRDCSFNKGDRVFGMGSGVLAEYITVACNGAIARVPPNVSAAAAAGCGVTCVTTYDALVTRRNLQPGQRLLVIGASGGCGSLAILLGKILGAHVTGICSERNREAVSAIGADEVVGYDGQSFDSWEPQELYDVIYDTVSSPDSRDPDYEPRGRNWLMRGAVYTAINSAQPMDWVKALGAQLTGLGLQREGFDLFLPSISQEKFQAIAALASKGFIPQLDVVYPTLSESTLQAGVQRQMSRRAKGKIVFQVVG